MPGAIRSESNSPGFTGAPTTVVVAISPPWTALCENTCTVPDHACQGSGKLHKSVAVALPWRRGTRYGGPSSMGTEKPPHPFFIRNLDAGPLLETFLVSAVAGGLAVSFVPGRAGYAQLARRGV